MELQAKLIKSLGKTEGVSKAGNPWMKTEWVAETFGQYPKKVKFHIFGTDRNNSINLEVGKDYSFSFDIESREYNERWYTDISVYAVQPIQNQMAQPNAGSWEAAAAPSSGPQFGQPAPAAFNAPDFGPQPGSATDDLPF